MNRTDTTPRPRVVILGAGFGGLSAAAVLANSPFDVTLVDQHNYHLFQPLLYQIATAGLSPADIASPIRSIMRAARNVNVVLAKVSGIDVARREVVAEGRRIPFDYLIVATGAQHAYFGHDEWAAAAPGLKTIDDATYLRRRILLAFEKAETETDPAERARLLNFIVVGGGPTGVEMAGAIAELANRALARDFRSIDPRQARIILVEAAPRLLTPFDPSLSEAARESLEHLGVEVRLGAGVTCCDACGVHLGAEHIEARTIVWGAGVMASPAGRWLGVETDQAGRVKVGPDLAVHGNPEIFVIGDVACATGADGGPLPGVAPVAKQQGQYVATFLEARLRGRSVPPFRYRDFGAMATIGRKRAVMQHGRIKLVGFPAWLLEGNMNKPLTQSEMNVARPLAGRVSLITGSTSGIGLGIARALAAAGSAVVLNGFGNPEEIAATQAKLADEFGVPVHYSGADMSSPSSIAEMMETTLASLGRIDVLVNNAGIQFVAPLQDFPIAKWDAILAINLSSGFHTTRLALPRMVENKWGRIVNIASAHGLVASPFKSAYVAAKHGIVGLTKVTALETAEQGVTCNAICPGYVYTPLVEAQIDDQAKAHDIPREQVIRDVLLAQQPNKRFVTVEELGALTVFLASDAAASITGIALPVDGGWTAH